MRFSYNWLKEYLAYAVSPQDVADILAMHSFEIETIEKVGDDTVLDINVLPNRAPDCYSHQGIAREVNAAIDANQTVYPFAPAQTYRQPFNKADSAQGTSTSPRIKVTIENVTDCPRYACQVVEQVVVTKSPTWLQNRLRALGLEAINNIVDITNYVMLDVGNPIHAFDLALLKDTKGSEPTHEGDDHAHIIVRRAKANEKITGLDGITYTLQPTHLVIATPKKPLAIAGIKGGVGSGISDNTTSIVLEAAHFDRKLIYTTSRAIKLKTDASTRFSAGVSQYLPSIALARAVELLRTVCGDTIRSLPVVDQWPGMQDAKTQQTTMRLDRAKPGKLLGIAVPEERITDILGALGCKVTDAEQGGSQALTIQPPFWRLDLTRDVDLVEEIGRMIGYEAIPATLPLVVVQTPEPNPAFTFRNELRRSLVNRGFDEIYSYTLVNRDDVELTTTDESIISRLALQNTLSHRHAYVRHSVLPCLLRAIAENQKQCDRFQLCEIGKIFEQERWSLGLAWFDSEATTSQKVTDGSYIHRAPAFFALRGAIDAMCANFGITDVRYESVGDKKQAAQSWFDQGVVAQIVIAGRPAGIIAQPNKATMQHYDIAGNAGGLNNQGTTAVAELDVAVLQDASMRVALYKEPPVFPPTKRDIAIEVDNSVPSQSLIDTMTTAGGTIVESISLFDYYEGTKVGAGKKSVAYHIVYRDRSRTLTDTEVNKAHRAIEQELRDMYNAVIR
ncbi:MAG: Phenylalanine-tRNA ligase beta subunit [Parcubacteria group bacterium GW2011_GWA2_47_8]|nr:MAG: Phenylalanine-tRNA ligase beta subunit [Parcubacteria group bacterium GW2011_GWA2_47_8]